MPRGREGWKKDIGKAAIENRLLLASVLARYQHRTKLNDTQLAKLLGVEKERLVDLAGQVVPLDPEPWGRAQGLNSKGFATILEVVNERGRLEREPTRMASVRLPESDHEAIAALARKLSLSVTGVYHRAIRELAERQAVAIE